MPARNSTTYYGGIAKTFHWLTALLILTLIPLGIIANGMAYEIMQATTPDEALVARTAYLFSLHKTLGVTVFFVALARILWAIAQPKPGPLHPDRKVEHWLAETVHWLLYGSLLLVPLTGWIHHASTTGFAPIWWPFGQSLPFVPKDEEVAALFAGLHIVFERVLIVSILLHVAGALKHHFVDKDATLRRMWFGQSETPDVPAHRRASLPLVTALTAWAVAIGIGGMLGAYESHAAQLPAAPALEAAQSEWEVTEGQIALTITQFGNTVEGSFAEWTSAIRFDPDVLQGKAGDVTTTISIPSLTLGSVTAQALGADFFDASTHPTAVFAADIIHIPDGLAADGTLTIKGNAVPVSLPFNLTFDGDTASMQSSVTLNRLDFGIGANMPDESSLAFSVKVDVRVTATRAATE